MSNNLDTVDICKVVIKCAYPVRHYYNNIYNKVAK